MRPTEQNISRLRADFMAVSIALSVGQGHGRLREVVLNRARLMAGADGGTFDSQEALATGDRPYANAMMLLQLLYILGQMTLDKDTDPAQLDDIGCKAIPGHIPHP